MNKSMIHDKSSKVRSSSTSIVETESSDQTTPLRTQTRNHYRLVVMGAAGVGKTCIVNRFLYENFIHEYTATVEELHRGEYEVNGVSLTLDILDTAGAFPFPAMRKLSIRTGDAFVLVYSIDDEDSFDEVKKIREQIIEEKGDEFVPIVIVGNKIDKEVQIVDSDSDTGSVSSIDCSVRPVGKTTAETTATLDWETGYIEASAKDDINIVGIFQELLSQAKIQYALSSAVKKRRQSSPSHFWTMKSKRKHKNNCTIT